MQMYSGQIYPPLIEPSTTEPYYTTSVWHVEEMQTYQGELYPPLIKPSTTEPYYTMSVWHV